LVAPLTLGSEGLAGPYLLDGVAGVARIRADGRVVGGPPGASPQVLARRLLPARCSASARGDLRLPTTFVTEGSSRGWGAVARYAFEGGTACLRGATTEFGGDFALAPEGEGWGAREWSRGFASGYVSAPRTRTGYRCTPQGPTGAGGTVPRQPWCCPDL
jgi:hypothetical protein